MFKLKGRLMWDMNCPWSSTIPFVLYGNKGLEKVWCIYIGHKLMTQYFFSTPMGTYNEPINWGDNYEMGS